MRKHRIFYIAALAAALVAYIAVNRGEPLALLCLLVAFPIASFLLQLLAMRGIKIGLDVKSACRMGKTLPVTFRIDRKSRLPLGAVRLRVVFENFLYQEETAVWFYLQPGEQKRMEFPYRFHAKDCGMTRIRIAAVEYLDIPGLFVYKRPLDILREVRVYPPELNLRAELSRMPEAKNFGDLYDRARHGQDVSEVAELREYVSGDPIRSIHWKLSARYDEMIVREFGYPSNYNTLILFEIAKKSGGMEISHARNNAVLALTVALSRSLIALGYEHNVGRMYGNELRSIPIASLRDHGQMEDNILYLPVQEDEDSADTVFFFLRGNYRSEYTKIIYITAEYNAQALLRLSDAADLMVLHVREGKQTGYASGAGYTVVPIDADTYLTSMQNIVL